MLIPSDDCRVLEPCDMRRRRSLSPHSWREAHRRCHLRRSTELLTENLLQTNISSSEIHFGGSYLPQRHWREVLGEAAGGSTDTVSSCCLLSDVGVHPAVVGTVLIVLVSPSPGLAPDSVLQTGHINTFQYNVVFLTWQST